MSEMPFPVPRMMGGFRGSRRFLVLGVAALMVGAVWFASRWISAPNSRAISTVRSVQPSSMIRISTLSMPSISGTPGRGWRAACGASLMARRPLRHERTR